MFCLVHAVFPANAKHVKQVKNKRTGHLSIKKKIIGPCVNSSHFFNYVSAKQAKLNIWNAG